MVRGFLVSYIALCILCVFVYQFREVSCVHEKERWKKNIISICFVVCNCALCCVGSKAASASNCAAAICGVAWQKCYMRVVWGFAIIHAEISFDCGPTFKFIIFDERNCYFFWDQEFLLSLWGPMKFRSFDSRVYTVFLWGIWIL